MNIKKDVVCIKIALNKHFLLIFCLYFYSMIQSGSALNNLINDTMKERGIFRNGCVTPRDGTIMNLLNLMLMKRKVNFQKGQVTSNVDRSINHLTFFCNAL